MKTVNRRGSVKVSGMSAAYAAAGVSVLATGAAANAEIVYSGVVNIPVADTVVGGGAVGVNLPFAIDGGFNLTLAHGLGTTNALTGYAFFGDQLGTPGVEVAGVTSAGYNYANNLAYGAVISTNTFLAAGVDGTLAFNVGYGGDQFLAPGIGFIGFKAGTNYGWVRVNMNGAPLNTYTIVDYAYGTAGESMSAGVIPEPSSLALLALGSLGMLRFRGNRKA